MGVFQAIKITDKVYWVGAFDDSLRDFHGYKVSRGTTYNAYLILGEKPVLIDTVKAEFFSEMMSRIASVIDPEKISYIISNHAEMDHSGCLPQAIAEIQPEKIFASKMGVKTLKEHFHFDKEITEVKETLTLGELKFTFCETRMLHWPDSMFTYFANDGILFSQDGFGMHLAARKLFAEQNNREIMRYEAARYFANILLPYTDFVLKLFETLPKYNLDIKIIAPDHGPIWRTKTDISWIMQLWQKWAQQNPTDKVVIVYDTMWSSTKKMAAAIAEGVVNEKKEVQIMPLAGCHRSDIAADILEAGALIVGSPTINQQVFPTIADTLCYLKGLKRKNLIGQAFGSYGWSPHATKLVQKELQEMGVKLVEDAVSVKYVPDDNALNLCQVLGRKIAKQL